MPHDPRPSLDAALQAVRSALEQTVNASGPGAPTIAVDELFRNLAGIADADGSIPLEDGSRLHIIPEQGDRRGDTGRVGAIQRFPDDRPDQMHLVAARRE